MHLFYCLALVLDSEAAACDWWRQHSTAQRAPHSQVLGSIPRPLHVLHGFSPGVLLQPRAVCTGQTGHSTPSSRCQCGGSLVPRSWNSAFKLKTASLQHGQCRKLKLVDLISTPNIIRQHLSLTIQMNHFPDTKYVFFLTVLPSLLLRLLYSSFGWNTALALAVWM